MEKEIVLRVQFMNVVYSGRKIVRRTLSDHVYTFSGKTKKEAIFKAKKDFKYSSLWHKTFSVRYVD